MSLFSFMLSKPAEQKIQDKKEVDSLYKYWRMRILYSMYFGYALFYFTRKSFTFAIPAIMQDLHLDKAEIGLLGTALYIVYGISKFINGMMSDRANPRYFMSIGLIMTGIANILFGLSSSMGLFLIFWIANGFFQGAGWPPCGKLLTHWYSKRERGTWWGIWNTSHNLGGCLIPLIVGFCISHWGWRYAMYVPGIISIIMGFVLMNRLNDVPETMGLPIIEDYKDDHPENSKGQELMLSTKEILFKYVINNKYIWLLCISYTFVYIVRTAINDWGAVYLTSKGFTVERADDCVAFFEVGGFFGSIISGWCSDFLFKGRRGPMNVIYGVGILASVLGLWLFPSHSFFINAGYIFAIGFFIFGPQMLLGVAAAELSHREAAGTATGFLGLFGYLGAALSGYPIGLITQTWNWTGFFITITVCSIISLALLFPMWSATSHGKTRKVE